MYAIHTAHYNYKMLLTDTNQYVFISYEAKKESSLYGLYYRICMLFKSRSLKTFL